VMVCMVWVCGGSDSGYSCGDDDDDDGGGDSGDSDSVAVTVENG